MKGKLLLIAVALLGIANLTLAQPTASWEWWRIEEGGVVEDLQLVYHDNAADPKDQVWAAVMNTGLYRSEWGNPNPNTWNNWEEHKPSIKGFGVDAIELNGTEYVLAAGGILGVWYCQDEQTGFDPTWRRPNNILIPYYPEGWKTAPTHDVAFYWPTTGVPGTPESQYYVILNNTIIVEGANVVAGLYLWDNTPPDVGFNHVANQPPQPRNYSHFYRDLENPNVLYVTSPDGIYKLSGPYGRETFVKLPASTRLEDLPVLLPQEIKGFDQLVKHFQK